MSPEDTMRVMVEAGVVVAHYPVSDVALCADRDCNRVFSVQGSRNNGEVRCPCCSSSSWLSLSTIVDKPVSEAAVEIKALMDWVAALPAMPGQRMREKILAHLETRAAARRSSGWPDGQPAGLTTAHDL